MAERGRKFVLRGMLHGYEISIPEFIEDDLTEEIRIWEEDEFDIDGFFEAQAEKKAKDLRSVFDKDEMDDSVDAQALRSVSHISRSVLLGSDVDEEEEVEKSTEFANVKRVI